MNKNWSILNFKSIDDERGSLVALEAGGEIPFDVKRIYYLFNLDINNNRGYHAHKELKQVLVCMHGECKILVDDGKDKEEIILDSSKKGLYLNNCVWREIYDFKKEAVLVAIVSEHYDEADYLRNYDDFIKFIEANHEN